MTFINEPAIVEMARIEFALRCIGAFCIGYLAMAGYLAQIGRIM